ncbi:MAG: hypothetical protein GX660_24985 [Clostridiaceae bacterium]|nr:hypothetical protein [Clostridiaceae bacterium]
MKITDLAIIFVVFTIPFSFMLGIKTDNVNYCTYKRIELNRMLDTAAQDAASTLVEAGIDNKFVINKEKAVETFFNLLYLNFNINMDSIAQKRLEAYVPVIVIVDYDGYHVLSSETFKGADGYKQIKQVWKPKKMYAYSDGTYAYSFSLDDYVRVYDTIGKSFVEGKRADLSGRVGSGIIQDEALFDQVRRRTIIDSIRRDINFYINRHNEIARQYAITYHFTLPVIDNEDWYRTVDDVGMLVFFQGLPVGLGKERFNSFALGGARIVKGQKYYIDTDADNIKRYHKDVNCPLLGSKDEILSSKGECAGKGYLPCRECRP